MKMWHYEKNIKNIFDSGNLSLITRIINYLKKEKLYYFRFWF